MTLLVTIAIAAFLIFTLGIVFASYFPFRALLTALFFSYLFFIFSYALLPPEPEQAIRIWTNIDLDNAFTSVPILIFLPPAASFLAGSIIGWIIFAVRTMRRRQKDRRTAGQF